MFVLGELGFFLFYATYFKMYGWHSPEPPGLFFVAILFGWGFGWLVVVVADTIKPKVDHVGPSFVMSTQRPNPITALDTGTTFYLHIKHRRRCQ